MLEHYINALLSVESRFNSRIFKSNSKQIEPYWKRKKCKSCRYFKTCSKNANNNACNKYCKKK